MELEYRGGSWYNYWRDLVSLIQNGYTVKSNSVKSSYRLSFGPMLFREATGIVIAEQNQ